MLALIKIYEESQRNLHAVKEYLNKNNLNFNNDNTLDEVDGNGCSAFFIACTQGYLDLADLLLELGANINIQNSNGWTPLHVAVSNDEVDRIEFLIKRGANPHIKNNQFLTARDYAEKKRDKLYYHHHFEFATQVKDYEWITEKYEQINSLINLMGNPKDIKPPVVNDFKTLTQEGIAISDLSTLSTKELKQLAKTLEQSFLHTAPKEEIQLNIDHQLTPSELIKTVFDHYPGMILGESHESEAPKRFVIENIDFLAEQGVKVIFLEHLLIEECAEALETYLTASDDGPIPEPLKTKLHLQDYHRSLKASPYNFTNLVTAVKLHNLKNPDKLLRIVPFDTEQSYSISSDNPANTTRAQVMNYLAHITIEKEKARFNAVNPEQKFKFVGFMGEVHTNTFNKAVGVANYQKVPGIALEQIDLKRRPSRAPLVIPDYRYWLYSQPNMEASCSPEKLAKYQQIINLFQYLDSLIPLIPDNFEARKPLNALYHEIQLSKFDIQQFNEKNLDEYVQRALELSPPILRNNNRSYSLLRAKVHHILEANLTQTKEEFEEIRKIEHFLRNNPLQTRENSREINRIIDLVKSYELREMSLNKYGQTGLLPALEIIEEPEKCPSIVWAVAIVEALESVLASPRELSELDFDMADKKQERILYPLYALRKEKRLEILSLTNHFIMHHFPKEREQYSRYLDLQLSKQSDSRNSELIKEDINFLLAYRNHFKLQEQNLAKKTGSLSHSHSPLGFFNSGGNANEIHSQCSLLRKTLNLSYNELAIAFPQLNWPVIDNFNLKFNGLTVYSNSNEFILKLCVQNLQQTNNNALEYIDNYVTLPIPKFLATALLHLSQSQTICNALSSMPVGTMYLGHNDNSNMQIYLRHAQGVHFYSLAKTAANTLIDQNNRHYGSFDAFLSAAMSFYKLPGIYPINTAQLLIDHMQEMAPQSLSNHSPR
ncbi:ankyrin repeat domain-containing protein [Legionella clemsonensis]|uniref:Ankyrin repeats (3 copies) n=1 Tax=Legionella clemsonensis TaxID=1867846 RepID=A0A222P459_9GAMM|nr:ankyrin repeat domain-containing protein [Legionella clemsonensis]ASQ46619.1 Ankyrin repeats (3 copies) [Legionella clemsonensis]